MTWIGSLKNKWMKLRCLALQRIYMSPKLERDVVREFHKLYYDSGHFFKTTFHNTRWLGIPTLKCPLDLWIYQEIIYEIKPDLIIETGTAYGGSALYLAHLCDLMGKGNVVTVDIENQAKRPKHSRIEYLTGSSVDPVILSKMGERVQKAKTVLVILDSDHRKPHVFQELQCYGPWVTKDSYLIVEDTNVNGHPVDPEYGPGPMEAVEDFLKGNNQFAADRQREKFYLTFNPSGYLKRIA